MKHRRSRVLPGLFILLLMALPAGMIQAADLQPTVGMLMVAREGLPDPRFRDSVVLLLQHDPQGSVGLIVNRSSRLPLTALLPGHAELLGEQVLSYGGPIAPKGLMALVHSARPPHPSRAILDDVYITGVEELMAWLPTQKEPAEFRIFVGYAGWAEGQLSGELARGDWRLLPGDALELFGPPESGAWQRLRTMRLL